MKSPEAIAATIVKLEKRRTLLEEEYRRENQPPRDDDYLQSVQERIWKNLGWIEALQEVLK